MQYNYVISVRASKEQIRKKFRCTLCGNFTDEDYLILLYRDSCLNLAKPLISKFPQSFSFRVRYIGGTFGRPLIFFTDKENK